MKIKKIIMICGLLTIVCGLIGCDAFVRKFTRKPKKEELHQEELVLVPQEYQPTLSKEQLYRQYYIYWQSWQDELKEALLARKSHKKQIDCAEQAIKNLEYLKTLLNDEKQKKLEVYIRQMKGLKDSISADTYGTDYSVNLSCADRLRRSIAREFEFAKMKGSLR